MSSQPYLILLSYYGVFYKLTCVLQVRLLLKTELILYFYSLKACFFFSSKDQFWSLGLPSSKLSYYDGLIQLTYRNGTAYNNEKKTQRSTLVTFLCDHQAGIGQPEYQVRSSVWRREGSPSQNPDNNCC